MEKVQHKCSVHSLLNPTTNDVNQNNNNMDATQYDNNIKNKRKRIKLFGIELDVPFNMTISSENELLQNLRDQILLFSDASTIQNAQVQYPPQQNNNNFYSFAAFPAEQLTVPEQKFPKTQLDDPSHIKNNISVPSTSFGSSSCNQVTCFDLPALNSEIPPFSTLVNHNNQSSLPSIPFQSDMTGDEEEFSAFLSALKNSSPPQSTTKSTTKKTPGSPPEPETTFIDSHGHKIKIIKIQPSAKDPPIEVRLIMDDPKTNPFTQQWMEHFTELKKFKEQYGHTNVTRSIAGYYNLGNWVAEQRRKFKQGKVTETQFNSLKELGFEWDRSYYFFRTRHKKRDRSSDSEDDD